MAKNTLNPEALVVETYDPGEDEWSASTQAAYCTGCTIEQQQAEIDATAAYPGTDFTFTGTYYLTSGAQRLASGSGTFNVAAPVPEPGSMILLGTGLLATIARRRSKKKST